MAQIVLGAAASHTTLMNTQWDKVAHLDRAHAYRDALGVVRDAIAGSDLDAVVILGSNHFRGFWLDLMPAFTIGVDEVVAAGEHGTPEGPLSTKSALALELTEGLLALDFDMAFSSRLSVDHGISHAVQYLLDGLAMPIIPIVINCFAPPLPSIRRTEQLGRAIGSVLDSMDASLRIGLIATGGLSHALPFPDWRSPESSDDKFIAESWREGRGRWADFEGRRREIIVNAPPRINEAFDRKFLERFSTTGLLGLAEELTDEMLVHEAGNGGNEIRAWIAMSAALGHRPARILNYSPMPEWLTGMGVALIQDI